MKAAMLLVAVVTASCIFVHAQAQEKVLWSFGGLANDGNSPTGALVADGAGNLYGTTLSGGANGYGAVFELSPQFGGGWTEAILYSFCSKIVNSLCLDGGGPLGGLVLDSRGNLYGAAGGGTSSVCGLGPSACGVVFELSPPSAPGGVWSEDVLYNFCSMTDCADGLVPNGGLVFDVEGNLYGTTVGGGEHGKPGSLGGTVFELSPSANGWIETILYNFCTNGSGKFCPDGVVPEAGVVFGPDGSLFGTTVEGGGKVKNAQGVVYQLSPSSAGWAETTLLSQYFSPSFAPVSFSSAGNLFGTTLAAGFELNAKKGSSRSALFTSETGTNSEAGVLIDGEHNALFGTASLGGSNRQGTVWEVTPSRQLIPVYSFCSQANCADGADPLGGLIEDDFGNLYGTAYVGGANGLGVVFEVTP
jgi:uncharacterized repeat protein (TIGR03803 family)